MFANEIKRLKDLEFRVSETLKFTEEVQFCIVHLGLTGALLFEASYEDPKGFEFDLYWPPPYKLKYDRRWVGFPELNEYDHMQNSILPQYYDFKPE